MKFRWQIVFVFLLSIWSTIVIAQCDHKITVDVKSANNKGDIEVKLNNGDVNKCILYAYESGKKIKIAEKSGNLKSFHFKDLSVDRYYSVELSFKKEDDLLCSAWVSELIQIKE